MKRKTKFKLSDEIESAEFQTKHGDILRELSKIVGAAAHGGNIEEFEFLIIYTTLIFNSGFEVLKKVIGEEKSRTFNEFLKKVGVLN